MERGYTLRGGARLAGNPTNFYVGTKRHLPRGFDAFPTINQSFRIGRRLGFRAGIDTGEKQERARGMIRAGVVRELRERTHAQEIAELERLGYITKAEVIARHPVIYAKLLASIARVLGMASYQSKTKAQLVAFLTSHPWDRVNLNQLAQ